MPRTEPVARLAERDLKAGFAALQASLRSWLDRAVTPGAAAGSGRLASEDTLYTARGLPEGAVLPLAPPHTPAGETARRSARADADAVEQLLRYVEGALARTRVHQFGALPEARPATPDAPPVPTWIAEIPLLHRHGADALQLRIEDHRPAGRDGAAPERVWQVLMCLDCAAIGPLHALVQLAGRRLSATLWAERAATLRAARAAIDELDSALRAQGVEVERLECMPGRPAATIGARFERLLDVRT